MIVLLGLLGALLLGPVPSEGSDRLKVLVEMQGLRQEGKYTEVVALLEEYLATAAPDPEILMGLGEAQEHLGLTAEAVANWQRILVLWPEEPSHYLQVTQRLRQVGQVPKAIELLSTGRKKLDMPDAFSWELAELYVEAADYPRAVQAWVELLAVEPQRYLMVEGRLRQLARQPDGAPSVLAALQKVWKKNQGSPALTQLLVVAALDMGLPQVSYKVLERAPGGAEAVPLIILFASRCEEYKYDDYAAKGYALVERHCGKTPHCGQALQRRAQLALQEGDFAAAARLYRTMAEQLEGRPEAVEARLELARIQLVHLNDDKGAQVALAAALKQEGNGPRAGAILELLADTALRRGDLDKAQTWLAQWGRLQGSGKTTAHYRVAELHFFKGDFETATEQLDELLRTNPSSALANDALDLLLLLERFDKQEELLKLFALGLLAERRGRPKQAQAQWAQLQQRGPDYLYRRGLLEQARIRTSAGQIDVALDFYSQLLGGRDGAPFVLEALLGTAQLREARGELAVALKQYETALLQFPDDVRAPELRLQIQRLRQLRTAGGEG